MTTKFSRSLLAKARLHCHQNLDTRNIAFRFYFNANTTIQRRARPSRQGFRCFSSSSDARYCPDNEIHDSMAATNLTPDINHTSIAGVSDEPGAWASLSLLATQSQSHAQAHVLSEELAWYNINSYVMDLVHFTHDVTGLSYASSIAAITVGIRLFIILPFGIMSLRTDPTIEEDIKRLKQKIETTKNTTMRNALIDQQKELSQRAKKQNRVRIGMPIASLGTFLLMWSGLRYMAVYYPQDLAAGGMLWFVDLTQRDPLIFLPVLSTITFYLMGEVNADQLGKPTKELSPKWRMFWRTFRATALLFLWDAPAAIFCYWLPNSTMSLAQAVILSQPPVRSALGIASEEEIRRVKKANAIEFVDESPVNQQSSRERSNEKDVGVGNAQKEIAQNISLRKRRKGGKRKR